MKNPESLEVNESESLRSALEEAYALALAGLFEKSLGLLDHLGRDPDEPGIRAELRSVDVARARVLLASGIPENRRVAVKLLSKTAEDDGDGSWRASLELARVARSEGRVTEAATLLKSALGSFRAKEGSLGTDARSIAKLLADEVTDLLKLDADAAAPGDAGTNSAESRPTGKPAPTPDPSSLLRLVDLGKRLATEGDPEQVLRIVLHEAIELGGAERGFLVLVRGDEYEFAFAENIDWSEVSQPSFEVSRTLIRRVMVEGRPILLRLTQDEPLPSASKSLADIGARSVACVPIVYARKTLGVLYLDGRSPAHSFHAPTERLLELFAAQAAAALENARQHRTRTMALEAAEETIRRQRSEVDLRIRYEGLVGASEAMQEVYKRLDLIAPTEMPVIVLGETGTGKELAARLVHSRGPRRDKEFVAINCAGLPETLLEGELFGHERGAFTGAERTRPGLFEVADHGTLFLDEVGDMSPRMQADLLRVLQSGEVRRIGGHATIHVDVRLIAATHRNLDDLVRRGEFRQDLYFRLNVLSIRLPPLRERAEDIPLLATELLGRLAPGERPSPRISEGAMRRLQLYGWPGNVRELENVLRRSSVLETSLIEEEHLPPEILTPGSSTIRPGTLQQAEDAAIHLAVDVAGGNKTEAARILGIDRKTLYGKLRRLGLHNP